MSLCMYVLAWNENASNENVFLWVSDKFFITIGKARNIFASEMDEWRYCHKLIHDFGQSRKSEFSFFSKVAYVGTLNLCLKMPDLMKKVLAQSDHPVQRKRPKCAKILENVKTAIFNGFWAFSRLTLIRLSSKLFH